MQLTIDPSRLSGLNAILTRANAANTEEGAEQISPEDYLTARVNELLESYTTQEIERVKQENAAFFNQAALLPPAVQQQLRDLIASAAPALATPQ